MIILPGLNKPVLQKNILRHFEHNKQSNPKLWFIKRFKMLLLGVILD